MTNTKKIVLIRPYFKEVLKQATFPLGLAYLAAELRRNNYDVKIYDLKNLGIENKEFIHYLAKIKPDFIGITALSWYYPSMVELCKLIKNCDIFKNIPLIIGGVHVSSLPKNSLRETNADFVVIGEGEITIIELLDAINSSKDFPKVNGIAYMDENGFIRTKERELIKDLDLISPPAWDLLKPENYPPLPHGFFYKKAPIFPIFTSRGCPFSCIYCASKNFWKNRIRFHSVQRVVDEIEFLVKNYGAKEIHIWDDNFTLNKKRVIEFCREINKRKLNLYFACPNGVKVDTLDEEILKYMRSIGFYMLVFAVESGSKKILKNIKKQINLDKVPSIITTAKDLGYFTRSFFMLGLPGEKLNDIVKSFNYAKKLSIDHVYFFIFTPLPGSSFFNIWIKDKNIAEFDWCYDFFTNPQDMKNFNEIDSKILVKLQRYSYIKFFLLRPFKLIKYILKLKPNQLTVLIERALYAIGIKQKIFN